MIVLIWIVSLITMAPDLIYMSAKSSQELSEAGLDTILYSDCNYDWSERSSKIFQFVKTFLLYLLPFILMLCAHYRIMLTLNAASSTANENLRTMKQLNQSVSLCSSIIQHHQTMGGGAQAWVVNKFYHRFHAPQSFIAGRQRVLQQHSDKGNASDYELHLVSASAGERAHRQHLLARQLGDLGNGNNCQQVASSLPTDSHLLNAIPTGSRLNNSSTNSTNNNHNNNSLSAADQQQSIVGSYCSANSAATTILNQHERQLRFTGEPSNCDEINSNTSKAHQLDLISSNQQPIPEGSIISTNHNTNCSQVISDVETPTTPAPARASTPPPLKSHNLRQKFAKKLSFRSHRSSESTSNAGSSDQQTAAAKAASLKRASVCSYQMTNDPSLLSRGSNHSNQLLVTMHNKNKLESRRAAAKMLMTIVVMFGICYLPVHLINFLR